MGEYGSETKFPIFFVSKESLGSQTQEEGGVQDIYKYLFVNSFTNIYKYYRFWIYTSVKTAKYCRIAK